MGKIPTAHKQSLNNLLQTDGKWHSHKPIFILKNLICVHYIDHKLSQLKVKQMSWLYIYFTMHYIPSWENDIVILSYIPHKVITNKLYTSAISKSKYLHSKHAQLQKSVL